MKPILIRINDLKASNQIVKQFKNYMKQRNGIDSVATINLLENTDINDLDILNKVILFNDHLILKNINSAVLFSHDHPFYENYEFSVRLILCTVIDAYAAPIFPKGFHTINVDTLIYLKEIKSQLVNDYAYIAYLSVCIQKLKDDGGHYKFTDKQQIEEILNKRISQTDKKIHSIISQCRKHTQIYQSAV